jgi:hypothetical protein
MTAPPLREIPACIAKREADAVFGWSSERRMDVTKGKQVQSLSADDLRRLLRFVEENRIQEQLS